MPSLEKGPRSDDLAVVRAFAAPGPRVDRVLAAREGAELPAVVQASLGDKSESGAERTNDWIEWLEALPWNRRSTAPIDLARVQTALDAGHAGRGHAKACLLEYLAVRRRNPSGSGAVLCFTGAPGTGKTSLAQCTAEALGRGFVKLACGGLHDETDLRGHNRTWRDAQPGSILRELRSVGAKDPSSCSTRSTSSAPRPPPSCSRSSTRSRTTVSATPSPSSPSTSPRCCSSPPRTTRPGSRTRSATGLEIVDPGYSEDEKVAIAEKHLVGSQNRAAGLTATPVRFTRGACRRMIRDYTSERGIRQLAQCLRSVCRQVVLGLETGDASPVRTRITAAQVPDFLGEPGVSCCRSCKSNESDLGSTTRCCGLRWHRQTTSVCVCSPSSRRLATLGLRFAGLTAFTTGPRTLVRTGSCLSMPNPRPKCCGRRSVQGRSVSDDR